MQGRGYAVSGIAGLVSYVAMVLSVAAVFVAAYLLWTDPAPSRRSTRRAWLLLIGGSAALCIAVSVL